MDQLSSDQRKAFMRIYARYNTQTNTEIDWTDAAPIVEGDQAVLLSKDLIEPNAEKETHKLLNKLIVIRLNCDAKHSITDVCPSSAVPATYLDLCAIQLLQLKEAHRVDVPLVIINSAETRPAIEKALRDYEAVGLTVHLCTMTQLNPVVADNGDLSMQDSAAGFVPSLANAVQTFLESDARASMAKRDLLLVGPATQAGAVCPAILKRLASTRTLDVMAEVVRRPASAAGKPLASFIRAGGRARVMVPEAPSGEMPRFTTVRSCPLVSTGVWWVRLGSLVNNKVKCFPIERVALVDGMMLQAGLPDTVRVGAVVVEGARGEGVVDMMEEEEVKVKDKEEGNKKCGKNGTPAKTIRRRKATPTKPTKKWTPAPPPTVARPVADVQADPTHPPLARAALVEALRLTAIAALTLHQRFTDPDAVAPPAVARDVDALEPWRPGFMSRLANLRQDGWEPAVDSLETLGRPRPQSRRRGRGRDLMKLFSGNVSPGNLSSLYIPVPTVRVTFDKSVIHAWGMFAGEFIPADTLITEYVGEVVTGQVICDRRDKEYAATIGSDYLFRFPNGVIDATLRGNLGRLLNHSCDPNCSSKIIGVDSTCRVALFTSRDISIGEELTYDYRLSDDGDVVPCHCGAPKCRGRLNFVNEKD